MPGAVQDLITHVNFGDDRVRGFGVATVEFFPFPLTIFDKKYRKTKKCLHKHPFKNGLGMEFKGAKSS